VLSHPSLSLSSLCLLVPEITTASPGVHYYNFLLRLAFVTKQPLPKILTLDTKLESAVPEEHYTMETYLIRARVALLKGDNTLAVDFFERGKRLCSEKSDQTGHYYLQMLTNLVKEHQLTHAEKFVNQVRDQSLAWSRTDKRPIWSGSGPGGVFTDSSLSNQTIGVVLKNREYIQGDGTN